MEIVDKENLAQYQPRSNCDVFTHATATFGGHIFTNKTLCNLQCVFASRLPIALGVLNGWYISLYEHHGKECYKRQLTTALGCYERFIRSNGPLARYVKLRVAHAPRMPGTFFSATASQRSRHTSRHVRDARAVMHAGIAIEPFPLQSLAGKAIQVSRFKCTPLKINSLVNLQQPVVLQSDSPSHCYYELHRHSRRMRNLQFYVSGKRPMSHIIYQTRLDMRCNCTATYGRLLNNYVVPNRCIGMAISTNIPNRQWKFFDYKAIPI